MRTVGGALPPERAPGQGVDLAALGEGDVDAGELCVRDRASAPSRAPDRRSRGVRRSASGTHQELDETREHALHAVVVPRSPRRMRRLARSTQGSTGSARAVDAEVALSCLSALASRPTHIAGQLM